MKELVAIGRNNVIIGIDVAYLDYSGEKEEVRTFFKKMGHLPKEILVCVCYSLSKGFTMYGQRVGAMIGISSDEEIADEFLEVNKSTSRAMANIVSDPDKFKAYEDERNCYYQLIRDRADIFKQEAAQVGLPMLPYRGGFFITIPTDSGTAICEELKKEHIYCIALGNGIRSLISSSAFNAKFSSAFLGAVRSPVLGSTNSTRSKVSVICPLIKPK